MAETTVGADGEQTGTTRDAGARRAAASTAPQGTGKLRAFRRNTPDDYFTHAAKDFPLPQRIAFCLVVLIVSGVTKLLWRWHIEDGELLWKDRRGRVLVMNHESMLDPVVVICSLYLRGITVRPIYKSEFGRTRIVTWFFSHVGGIPVKRDTADMQFVRRSEAALKRGECILIFPEGTRVRSDDQPIEFHKGFALVARLAKAPVQPVAIVGARDITPKGTHLKRLVTVHCKAGSCISFDELGVKGRKEQVSAMEQVVMKRVYGLRDELRAEHPGKM